jgi:1-acyl-sn-glycerol-3-phosphate acyltransferase
MGILFLDRSSSRERMRMLKTLAKTSSGKVFVVFPQGTTSRITDRKPFKRGIFKIVELNPDISLLPVTIHYKDDAHIAWHKPQSLRENAIRVCARNRISVKVTLHKPVTFKDYKKRTSAQIAQMVEQTVLEHLQNNYSAVHSNP